MVTKATGRELGRVFRCNGCSSVTVHDYIVKKASEKRHGHDDMNGDNETEIL